MKLVMVSLIALIVVVLSITISVKTANHLIKTVDPLAQQIMVLDQAKSTEIVSIKGEIMRDLVRNYYNHKDSTKRVHD